MHVKSPDPLDVIVGQKIRIARTSLRMSQTKLANELGVTFQQVQKYEKGVNRVGAGRLSRIASVLGIPITELFGEVSVGDPDQGDGASAIRLLAQPGAVRMLKAFERIGDRRTQRALIEMMESVADAPLAVPPPNARSRKQQRPKARHA